MSFSPSAYISPTGHGECSGVQKYFRFFLSWPLTPFIHFYMQIDEVGSDIWPDDEKY
jgi:hypothetical protein